MVLSGQVNRNKSGFGDEALSGFRDRGLISGNLASVVTKPDLSRDSTLILSVAEMEIRMPTEELEGVDFFLLLL